MKTFKDCLMAGRRKDMSAKKNGGAQPSPAPREMKLPVTAEILRSLYARMLRCRMSGERAQLLLRRNGHAVRFGTNGAEAAIAGATIELLPEDAVAPLRHDPAVHFAMGMPVAQVFAEMFANNGAAAASASGEPEPSSVRLIPTLAAATSQLCVAAGVAAAYKMQKKQNVVVALTDERSLTFGSSHEALNFAAFEKLPLVVMVDAGELGDPESIKGLEVKAEAYGIPGIAVDGNDAIAVYRVAHEAINRARSGRGPSLIEYRVFDPEMDAIEHMEGYLDKHGWWTPDWKRQLSGTFAREIDQGISAAVPRKK